MEVSNRLLVPDDFSPGIYPGESDEIYFRRQLGVASNSVLKIVDTQTPAHYLHYVRTGEDEDATPIKDTDAQIIGRAFHCYVLEPAFFKLRYKEMPDFGPMQSSKNRARMDEWMSYQPKGVTYLKPKWMAMIKAMHESLLRHKTARLLLEQGQREVVFRWIDPETGLPCKSKVDLWDRELGFYLDLKSCMSAHPREFSKVVTNYRYYVQHVLYSIGAKECGVPIRNFLLVPVEKVAPHFSAVYHIDAAAEERGFEVARRSLGKLRTCMDRYLAGADLDDAFPAYGDGIQQLTLPGWAYSDAV